MNKPYISYFIYIFMMTVLFLSLLFTVYYLTPNNYLLYEYDIKTNKHTLTFKTDYIIKPNDSITLDYQQYHNYLLRIINANNSNTCIILSNDFKSENIYIDHIHLLKMVDSNLIIQNSTNENMKITIEFFNIIKL
jgi:hypothetical protein